jgi:uncharacterized membrane protein
VGPRRRAPLIALSAIYAAYAAAWSYISIMRLLSLNAFVFDLGVNMQFAWDAVLRPSLRSFLHDLAYKGIVYVVAPVFLTGSYPAILIFQSAFIGLGAFPIYGIARRALRSEAAALAMAASYLIYFPLAGVNWYDAHYQALFPTLFLLGYYFYLSGRRIPSLVSMALSGITHYPYTVFPLMFSLMLLLGGERRRDLAISAPLLAFSASIFALNLALGGVEGATVGTVAAAAPSASLAPVDAYTVFLFLLPLLFLPLLSRWAIFLAPYAALLALTSYPTYRYPAVFMFQYPAMVVPFVYLGAIEGIALLSRGRPRRAAIIAAAVLASTAMFAAAYQPYGPLNGASSLSYGRALGYDLGTVLRSSHEAYYGLEKIASMIPSGSTVLIQENMPEFFPSRWRVYDSYITPPGEVSVGAIQYAVADPYSFTYARGYAGSMQEYFEELWRSGEYGIFAEAGGIVAIARNYSGPPMYFSPVELDFGAARMSTSVGSISGGVLNVTDYRGSGPSAIWYGPYTSLVPGAYEATFRLYTDDPDNALLLQVTADRGAVTLAYVELPPGSLAPGRWNLVNVTFYSGDVYTGVEFRGLASSWNGTLLLGGVELRQLGPGLPSPRDLLLYPSQLQPGPGSRVLPNGSLVAANLTDQMVWYGPFTELQPGYYEVEYSVSTTNSSPGNVLQLQVTADRGAETLAELWVTGSDLGDAELLVHADSALQNVEFRGYAVRWNGAVELNWVKVTWLGSGPPALNVTYPAYGLMAASPSYYRDGLIEASNASNRIIWYGPYATLQPGYYDVTFILGAANQSPLDGAQLQVTSDYGKYYLATIGVTGQYLAGREGVSLPVYVNSTQEGVEFRCAAQAWNGTIYLYGVRVVREGGAPPRSVTITYPASQMWIPASGASRYADGVIWAANASGTVWYGPYATLYPGSYNVTFLVRGEARGGELELQATSDYGKYYLATSTVDAGSLTPGSWTPITLSFDVSSTQQFAEFRGIAIGWDGTLELANVTVEWRPPG